MTPIIRLCRGVLPHHASFPPAAPAVPRRRPVMPGSSIAARSPLRPSPDFSLAIAGPAVHEEDNGPN